ncbi:D-proline reductase (dithiol) proprotein PrdA [Companilactobacillus sp.]|jgi:D-proline reductase (dithiol) PrdA|uniref:D-proline reductase (dithiol) proprotein PrdA n=1 Tax=Companilactobacillus sp. TaxID=2767905 RepID=UPI0025B84618|nr:D-proline reductase (dithiol) proprotein PrdA [Companilactobacillus sp.]MCH4010132.1 D-proline reductase (dithiol) proprotein PrdA [Companilactobacillus sp.]MCH4052192.1 D-proline reductase (dithiol) proprotein PrdA [Companilactobacillus sp.]MCH4078074.1 D-proline reductase (dithiol) proprotein PrdA [Companilactobacillus sp.]MCH4126650.1 D-proline reductase (dithiol) proprotein PrdA [Companilactobacillus sp.]MCH4132235.1 D-proline reductase (dithiol) proprotein PrdA [Companilactobacillus sp
MSISKETAMDHIDDPAVLCCRAEGGITLEAPNLEDPELFPDYVDSGLLELPDDVLTIGQVLGATLKETTDALIPLTPANVDNIQTVADDSADDASSDDNSDDAPAETAPATASTEQATQAAPSVSPVVSTGTTNGVIKIDIAKGEGIHLEVPTTATAVAGGQAPAAAKDVTETASAASNDNAATTDDSASSDDEVETKIVRELERDHFKIDEVKFGDKTEINGTTLTIRTPKDLCAEAVETEKIVKDMTLEIITPDDYDKYSETIMDVQPIATKTEGEIGSGVTRVLDGTVFMLTGTDENGVQIGEFGSSEGELNKNIMWNRPGSPDKGDILIKAQVTIEAGRNMERVGPLASHKAADIITQEIREALKKADEGLIVNKEELVQKRHPNQKRVVIVKEIMGQGAMHDNLIMPIEPVGTLGAKPNVDLGNLPIMLSPLEVLDGGIHALTCIGPASKETSRHYWREPMVTEAMNDEDIDLVGVLFVGSPQANTEKFYVSKRLGMTVEAMDVDGAIVTTEGFGNNHIDFASHLEEIGKRDVPVVGMTYSAVQGALVVGNKYMDAMVDNNKSAQGIENEIFENNTLCPEDAIRALAMLETKMAGGKIEKPERKWNPNVKENNIKVIEKHDNIKIDLEPNEQSLPKSKKRLEIYEKE